MNNELLKWKYPSDQDLRLVSIEVETDLMERPILRNIINKQNIGTIIVHYRSDLYVQGTGRCSTEDQRKHAEMLKSIVNAMIPVISLRGTRENPGVPLITKIKQTSPMHQAVIYFHIADNYSDNRQKIESHILKIFAKPNC